MFEKSSRIGRIAVESILGYWPWYVVGPIIGLFVPIMAVLGKKLGISSNLRHLCTVALPSRKVEYLNYSVKSFSWSLWFFGGLFAGGLIGQFVLSDGPVVLLPGSYASPLGISLLLVGGIAIGFGTRWAEGCTSGHAISGLSHLQKASLVASVSFFAGGLFMRAVNWAAGGIL